MHLKALIHILIFLLVLSPGITVGQHLDKAAIDAMLVKSRNYISINTDSALSFALIAIKASKRIDYNEGIANGHSCAGVAEMNLTNYESAFNYYKKAETSYRKIGDSAGIAQIYAMMGVCYGMQQMPAESLAWMLKALRLREQLKDEPSIADLHQKLGLVYDLSGNLERAINHTKISLDLSLKLNDKKTEMASVNSLGIFHAKQGDFNKALNMFLRAQKLAGELNRQKVLADVTLNIGKVNIALGKLAPAFSYLQHALGLYTGIGYPVGIARTWYSIAELHQQKKNYRGSEIAANQSLALAREIGDNRLVLDNLAILKQIAEQKQDYRTATLLGDSINELKDTIYNADKTELLEKTKAAFDLEKKENKIALLEQENKAKTSQRNLLLLIAILSVIMLITILLLYVQKRNKGRLLAEQQRKIEQTNKVRDKLISVVGHDLRTPLTTLISVVDLLSEGGLSEEETQLIWKQLRTSAAVSLDTMENILAWGKNQANKLPVARTEVDLYNEVEHVFSLYESTAKTKELNLINNVPPGTKVVFDQDHLSFIIRNLVGNSLKFSLPGGRITLDAKHIRGKLSFSVADQGKGITQEKIDALLTGKQVAIEKGTAGEFGSGLGLPMVLEFISNNSAIADIQSQSGSGVKFTIITDGSMPIAAQEKNKLHPV